MAKIKKQHYILIFLLAFMAGLLLRGTEYNSFEIVKSSTAYAPESVNFPYNDSDDRINLNEANVAELDSLYGIGEEFAERIVDYRNKNGKFEEIQDIMKVSGIGKKTYNEIKDHIYVE